MKVFVLTIGLFFASFLLKAQTIFDDGSLQDALAKAKKEGKMVMIVASATWCAPCQALKKNVFPTKEAGDYFNANFILKHYELDKSDPDQVSNKYNITAFPTSVILDANGYELARVLGGSEDSKGFIEKIKKAISPNNRLDARKKCFQEDDSYGIQYVRFLYDSCYKHEEANEALNVLFKRRSVKENFNIESMEYYKSPSVGINSIVISYMLENPLEVISIIGEKEYKELLTVKVNDYIMKTIYPQRFKVDNFKEAISGVMRKKDLRTAFVLFMNDVKEFWGIKDFDAIFVKAEEYIKKADSKNRWDIMMAVRILCGRENEILDSSVYALIYLFEKCIQIEDDIEKKKMYENCKIDMENILRIRSLK